MFSKNKYDLYTNQKIINTLFFFLYLFIIIFYGKIRVILYDGSLEIITFLENKTPHLAEKRYPLLICQILPVLFSKLNFGPKSIIYSYIINHMLLPILAFCNARYLVKNESFVSIIGISLCCVNTLSFFVASHDSSNAFYYLLIFYPFLDKKYNPIKNTTLLKTISFLGIFIVGISHLSQYIALFFLVSFLWINKRESVSIYLLKLFFIITIVFKLYFLIGKNERNFISDLAISSSSIDVLIFNSLFKSFLFSLFSFNFILLVVICVLLLVFVLKKSYKTLFTYLVFSIGFILIISIIFRESIVINWYSEPHFKFIGLLTAIYIIDILKNKYFFLNQCLIYFLFFFSILLLGKDFKAYYNFIKKTSRNINENTIFLTGNKLFLLECNAIMLPAESAVINLLENNRCYYFYISNDEKLNKDMFFMPKGIYNKNYFCFDTSYSFKNSNLSFSPIYYKGKFCNKLWFLE